MDTEQTANTGESTDCTCEWDAPGGAPPAPADTGERRGEPGPDRRLEKRVDRRAGVKRRHQTAEESGYTGPERREKEDRRDTLERRRGPGRRRSDDRKSAEEGEMNGYQFEFVQAIQTYKRINKRLYPTFTELLEILHQLGYRKVKRRTVRLDVPEPDLCEE